jgi:hypothetical protein
MKKPASWKAKAGYHVRSALAVFLTRPQAVYLKSAQLSYAILAIKNQGKYGCRDRRKLRTRHN